MLITQNQRSQQMMVIKIKICNKNQPTFECVMNIFFDYTHYKNVKKNLVPLVVIFLDNN